MESLFSSSEPSPKCTATGAVNESDKYPDRKIAKARTRKPKKVFHGRSYADFGIRKKMERLKLDETITEQQQQQQQQQRQPPIVFPEQSFDSPLEPQDKVFSIGTFTKPLPAMNLRKTTKLRSKKAPLPYSLYSLHNIELVPTANVDVAVSYNTRMNSKCQMKTLHECQQSYPFNSTTRHKPSLDEEDNQSTIEVCKSKTFSNFHTGKTKKQKKMLLGNPLFCQKPVTEDEVKSNRAVDNDVKNSLDSAETSSQNPDDVPEAETSRLNDPDSLKVLATSRVQVQFVEKREMSGTPQFREEEGDKKDDQDVIMLDLLKLDDNSSVDKIIATFPQFSINHCLFLHSVLGRPMVYTVEQKFSSYSLDKGTLYKTLLHMAVSSNRINAVKYLVEKHDAKVDVLDCCGRTPLMHSLANPAIIKYLINAGANVNHRDKNGISPLMLLAMSDVAQKASLVLLLQAGADPLVYDLYGQSVLYHALVTSNREILETLFEVLPAFPNSRVGQFTFVGRPLFNSLSSLSPALMSLKHYTPLPDTLKLSVLFLKAILFPPSYNPNSYENYDGVYTQLMDILQHKSQRFDYPMPILVCEGRKEVQTVEELRKLCSRTDSDFNRDLEIAFQCFIIAERIIGHACYNSIEFFKSIICLKFDKDIERSKFSAIKPAGHKKFVPFFTYFLQMLQHNINRAPVEPGSNIEHFLEFSVRVLSNFDYESESKNEMSKILLEIMLGYYTGLSKVHFHNMDNFTSLTKYSTLIFEFSKYLVCFCNESLISKFVSECPRVPYMNMLEAVLKEKEFSVEQIEKLLELGNANALYLSNQDNSEYLIHTVSRHRLGLAKKLLAQHRLPCIDAVNSGGYTPWNMPSRLRIKGINPSSLYCLAASAVVSCEIPYRELNLPQHVIKFVALHDKTTFMFYKMEGYGFIHHRLS